MTLHDAQAESTYVRYSQVYEHLNDRLGCLPDEIALWACHGYIALYALDPDADGIRERVPPEFLRDVKTKPARTELMQYTYDWAQITAFDPSVDAGRYLTYQQAVKHLSRRENCDEDCAQVIIEREIRGFSLAWRFNYPHGIVKTEDVASGIVRLDQCLFEEYDVLRWVEEEFGTGRSVPVDWDSERDFSRAWAESAPADSRAQQPDEGGGDSHAQAQSVAVSRAQQAANVAHLIFERFGGGWRIGDAKSPITIRSNDKGFEYVRWLVKHPGQEYLRLNLMRIIEGGLLEGNEEYSKMTAEQLEQEGLRVEGETAYRDATPAEKRALAEYKSRVAEIDKELEQDGPALTEAEAERLRSEKDWLSQEIRELAVVRNLVRDSDTEAARAKDRIGKPIARVLRQIVEENSELGGHLVNTIQPYGSRIAYTPQHDDLPWR